MERLAAGPAVAGAGPEPGTRSFRCV